MDIKHKLWRQIIILSLVIVGVGLLFVFVVFPVLVRITGQANTARNEIVEQKMAPQAPIFNTAANVTSEADFTVSGFAKSNTTVQLVLNGEKAGSLTVGSDGRFQAELHLMEGENNLSAYVIDEDGLESANSAPYLITLDSEKPSLTFDPEPSREIVGKNNRTLNLTGQTEANSKIYINGTLGSVNEAGDFVLTYYLNDGDNELNIEVIDQAGNSEQVTLNINFKP